MTNNSSGTQNTAVGKTALAAVTTTNDSTAVGYNALVLNTAAQSTAVGSQALAANTSGAGNTAVGFQTLNLNQTGGANTAVGIQALLNNTGNNNTACGASALLGNTSAANNTAVGKAAMQSNSTGADCTAIGYNALNVSTASFNTAVGSIALDANTTGNQNVSVGYNSMGTNISGNDCVAVGANSLRDSTASQNVAIGSGAGLVTTGTNNTYLGYAAGTGATTGSNNVIIGASSVPSSTTISNQTVLGNSSTTTAYLFGIPGAIASSNLVTTTGTSTGQLGTIPSTANSGIPLIAQGNGVSPVYGTALVAGGGTGVTSFGQNNSLILSGTSGTGALQQVTGGTSNTVLAAAGAATVPTFKTLSANMQIFTANGTYTPTAGMVYCDVECLGAGGGAGGCSAVNFSVSGGAGSGAYSRKCFSAATIGASQTIVIGTGGSGGIGAADGTDGGATTFGGTLLTAAGGGRSLANSSIGGAIAAAAVIANAICIPGRHGGPSLTPTIAAIGTSGAGADSPYGTGGYAQLFFIATPTSAFDGVAASGYGAGGGGASVGTGGLVKNGGSGTSGLVIITEYILS